MAVLGRPYRAERGNPDATMHKTPSPARHWESSVNWCAGLGLRPGCAAPRPCSALAGPRLHVMNQTGSAVKTEIGDSSRPWPQC